MFLKCFYSYPDLHKQEQIFKEKPQLFSDCKTSSTVWDVFYFCIKLIPKKIKIFQNVTYSKMKMQTYMICLAIQTQVYQISLTII